MTSNSEDRVARGLAVSQDPILQFALRYLAKSGFILPQQGGNARAWCMEQAELGSADAQVALGEMFNLGLFGDENGNDARQWFQAAADRGHPAALVRLASFAEAGSKDEPPQPELAVTLLQRAAKQDYGPALSQLSVLYLNGINVETDRDQAVSFLRKAAEIGDAQGQYILGAMMIKSDSASDVSEGIRWIQAAALQGYAGAHRHLGYLYRDGSNGTPRDEVKSRQHFFTASQIEEDAAAAVI
jgi:uncharacterized protein